MSISCTGHFFSRARFAAWAALYDATGDARYVSRAQRAADWISAHRQLGGGGFSRALTSFTYPVYVPCYYYYYGYGGCVGNVTVAKTSTNQGNIDIGIGGEWRVSPYDRGKIFLEARYQRLFSPTSSLPPGGGAGLVPVTLGYRW